MKIVYIECACGSQEHRLVFYHYPKTDTEESDLYLTCSLRKEPNFLKRLYAGLLYIFGKGRAEFSDTIITKESAEVMLEILREHIYD